ncbi:MAG TPA: GGDEF domain-containing protein [Caproiciproducens sp.]|nr:GGDEF domain-containing protein [Caproiciproducens sp.]
MKIKRYWMVLLPVIPCIILLLFITDGNFHQKLNTVTLIAVMVVLIGMLIAVWWFFVIQPVQNLLNAVNRAIHGDYRARFSCYVKNDIFSKLSKSFNQFMYIVEQQTEEISKNRVLQNQLYENEKIYRSALELTCERVFEADLTHNKLIYGQSTYNRIFPFLKTELYDEIIKSIAQNAIHEEDASEFAGTFGRDNLLERFSKRQATEICMEYRQKMSNGEFHWRSATLIHLVNQSDDSVKAIGYVKDVDERKRQELEILKQSQKDGLTGLFNKKFTQSLAQAYLDGEGSKCKSAAVMLDIDNFKGINDTLGHMEGDTALVHVAEKLQNVFRATDIIGRIGGDEFFIFVKNYVSLQVLTEKLELLCSMFKEIRLGSNGDYRISGSIGVALYPDDGNNFSELFLKADNALYFSKQHGKDRFHIYSLASSGKASVQNSRMESAIGEIERSPERSKIKLVR